MSLSAFLLWVDASAFRTQAIAWGSLGVLLALVAAPWAAGDRPGRRWLSSPWLFAGAFLLTVIAFRWQVTLVNRELQNPDESQMIAASITVTHDPLYFRSVDGTTHGPVDDIPLALLGAAGLPMDYRTAHVLALGLVLAGCLATWLAIRSACGEAPARLAILPLMLQVAFCGFWDFVQLSSEQFPAMALALACGCTVHLCGGAAVRHRSRWLAAAGLSLGLVPFAKLQAMPIAVYCGLATLALVLADGSSRPRARLKSAAVFIGSGLVIPVLLLCCIYGWGQGGEFERCYIRNNFYYSHMRWYPYSDTVAHLASMCQAASGFGWYFVTSLLFVLSALVLIPRFPAHARRASLFAAGLMGVSLFVVIVPGRDFEHYLQLSLFPTALAAGLLFAASLERLRAREHPLCGGALPTAFFWILAVGLNVGGQVWLKAAAPWDHQGDYAAGGSVLSPSPVAREISRLSRPGDALAIWGWTPRLWVETGLWQGTRDGNASRQIDLSPYREEYRARFLRDMRRNAPAVFVDSTGGANFLPDRDAMGHERCAELAQYVEGHYRLVTEIDAIRIYGRR